MCVVFCRVFAVALFVSIFLNGCALPPPASQLSNVSSILPEESLAYETEQKKESEAERAVRLVKEATELCRAVSLSPELVVSRNGRVVLRPLALCAYDEEEGKWHTVIARMTHFSRDDWTRSPAWREQRFSIIPITEGGYVATRVPGSGFGVSRLSVSLSLHGRPLTVYRVKHVRFASRAFNLGDPSAMRLGMEYVDLTPDHPDFHGIGLDRIALTWLFAEAEAIRADLDARNVASHAFPGRRLTEIIPPEVLMSVPVIEHMDQGQYNGNIACAGIEEGDDENPRIDPAIIMEVKRRSCVEFARRDTIEGALVVYALNRGEGNAYSVSSAGASGAWQFMNSRNVPTYDTVVRMCPNAGLDPSYESGVRDFRNAGKAAMCLLDLNLAGLPETHELYLRNPVLGGIYLIAAYNGGPRWARELFRKVHEKHPDAEAVDIVLPRSLSLSKKVRVVRPGKRSYTTYGKRLNGETPGYADKFLEFLDYLEDTQMEK